MLWPHEDDASLNAFYGNPMGPHGPGDPHWEAENLVLWTPPYPLFFSNAAKSPLKSLRVHKKCKDVFDAAYLDVLKKLGLKYIQDHHLDISGGTYVPRLMRGSGSRLSVHTWGCAVDMDPARNPWPGQWKNDGKHIDHNFAEILISHGFDWRGDNGDNDPMHFQLARHR